MTHDELLQKLADIHNEHSDFGAEANKQYHGMVKFYSSLRAVVELHKPAQDYFGGDDIVCKACSSEEFEWIYPCPTIQAIEKELQ